MKTLTLAVWEAIIAISTLVTVCSLVLRLAWTLSTSDLTHVTLSTIHITCTRETIRVAEVACITSANQIKSKNKSELKSV